MTNQERRERWAVYGGWENGDPTLAARREMFLSDPRHGGHRGLSTP
jgi:hypothetical protein